MRAMPNAAFSPVMPSASSLSSERPDNWDPETVYVIGHRRPDTDAIASALGYAWFLAQTGHEEVHSMRAGQPPDQTVFALKRFGQAPPPLLTAVAPTFGHVAEKRPVVSPDAPLAHALARLAAGDQVAPVVDAASGKPMGVVTPLALARAYSQTLNAEAGNGRARSTAVLPFAPPLLCREIAETIPTFAVSDRISDHRSSLLRAESNQFLVVDEQGRYAGLASQSDVLSPPRAKLILVDHNELSQAVAGADEAEIVGVLDHHRLGNPPTAAPIPFVVDPVGSTSTLVAEQCRARNLAPPFGIAGMLLSGILSDTLVFRSPTTSERDCDVAPWLARHCGVSDVAGYGDELLRASPGFVSRTADEIVDGDRKAYEMAGLNVSVGQVETTGLQELPQRKADILAALDDRRGRESLSLICLMVTDVVTGRSRLLCRGETRLVTALPFSRVGEGEFDLGDMVSRKKQLVPALLNALESAV